MAWETALDRLLIQQIHLAEKNEQKPNDVRQQILDLHAIAPDRPETAFSLGYARALLGLELPVPAHSQSASRWYTYGRLRGHDRRGERNWVADMLHDPAAIMDLLQEPRIAAQCLPLVMRTLFWCGDVGLAVKAIEFLAHAVGDADTEVLVDAALTDLLTRLERRVERDGEESTATILQRCVRIAGFERLPNDVRARYHKALAEHLLVASDFDEALVHLRDALRCSQDHPRLASAVAVLGALAEMKLHSVFQIEPRAERVTRSAGLSWIDKAMANQEHSVPEAMFVRGILSYEVADFTEAASCFDAAVRGLRRTNDRDSRLLDRARFFLAASLLAAKNKDESARALHLMEQALDSVKPDLESFYPVHEALKELDRRVALKFLDSVDVGRGTAPDQLLFVALEYMSLGEAEPAASAAERVLQIAVNLDQRIEALRILLTARNTQGERVRARRIWDEMRDLLMQRGKFHELEVLLKNESFVGQALDHIEIKCELATLYEEMEGKEYEKATLQAAIARSLRARKETDSLLEAYAILKEVNISFPEIVGQDLVAIEKLLELEEAPPTDPQGGVKACDHAKKALGHAPKVLVVGGNERQRRHHPRFVELAAEWGFEGEWLMANYTSPQKIVNQIADRLKHGKLDVLVLLHWNRHETTEPALDLARKAGVLARTVHYAGFTSLQVALVDVLGKVVGPRAKAAT